MKARSTTLKKFGKRVQILRKEKGISSQLDFALKSGLDRSYVGGIERGERNISLITIEKIAETLEVSMSELFDY